MSNRHPKNDLENFKTTHPWPDHVGRTSLFKFMSINSEKPDYVEHLFLKKKLYHSLAQSFNDPFEGKPCFALDGKVNCAKTIRDHLARVARSRGMTYKEADKLVSHNMKNPDFLHASMRRANEEMYNKLRVTCFTTRKENLLFWAHYANSHKGFCVEFDATSFPVSMSYKVEYSNTYPKIEYPMPKDMRAFKPALVKSEEWAYEDEFRSIFIPGASPRLKDDGESLPLTDQAITNVYLGARIGQEEQCLLLDIIARSDFSPKVWKTSLSDSSFELVFSEV
ncbi:DUF2971 domain-containing protein [Vibrio maritimus]|uniref:DUF2971 domain-containing protein n=1 Tax=Vibrio maritimus TaxID=990268 RepID=UPI004068F7E0